MKTRGIRVKPQISQITQIEEDVVFGFAGTEIGIELKKVEIPTPLCASCARFNRR